MLFAQAAIRFSKKKTYYENNHQSANYKDQIPRFPHGVKVSRDTIQQLTLGISPWRALSRLAPHKYLLNGAMKYGGSIFLQNTTLSTSFYSLC